MTTVTDPSPLSTIGELPDYLLLAQAKQLARHEQALQILVLDHLREIEARRLYLRRGYGSLFDYVVHELDYTAAAAWRRINAMRLCTHTRGARELLRDGSLSLSNATQLQHAFARDQRSRRHPTYARRAEPGAPGTDNGSTSEPAAGAVAVGAGAQQGERGLDAAVKEQLVQQAAGKSTREVTQMLAAVSPELAAPSDRLRALGDGRWELKAVLDGECQRGMEQLRMLLSQVDPQLTLGKLVGRLVQDGLDRYDPTRTRRRQRTTVRAAGTWEEGLPDSTDSGVQRAVSRAPAGHGDPASSAAKQLERSGYHAPGAGTGPAHWRQRRRVGRRAGSAERKLPPSHHFAAETSRATARAPVRRSIIPRPIGTAAPRRRVVRRRTRGPPPGRVPRRVTFRLP